MALPPTNNSWKWAVALASLLGWGCGWLPGGEGRDYAASARDRPGPAQLRPGQMPYPGAATHTHGLLQRERILPQVMAEKRGSTGSWGVVWCRVHSAQCLLCMAHGACCTVGCGVHSAGSAQCGAWCAVCSAGCAQRVLGAWCAACEAQCRLCGVQRAMR